MLGQLSKRWVINNSASEILLASGEEICIMLHDLILNGSLTCCNQSPWQKQENLNNSICFAIRCV